MKVPLSKPFTYEDLSITEIDLDFDKASTTLMERADKEMTRRKLLPGVKQQDSTYCLIVASYLCGVPYNTLRNLPLKDGRNIVTYVSGFLLGMEEEDMIPTVEEEPTEAET